MKKNSKIILSVLAILLVLTVGIVALTKKEPVKDPNSSLVENELNTDDKDVVQDNQSTDDEKVEDEITDDTSKDDSSDVNDETGLEQDDFNGGNQQVDPEDEYAGIEPDFEIKEPEKEENKPETDKVPEDEYTDIEPDFEINDSDIDANKKPEVETTPEDNKKPESETTPEDNKKPESETTPEDDKKPESDAEPEDDKKPESDVKPEDDKKPESDTTPEDNKKPEADTKPEDNKEPEDPVQTVTTLVDNGTGVSFEALGASTLHVTEVQLPVFEDETKYSGYVAFDITAEGYENGTEAVIKLPIPDSFAVDKTVVYYVADDGSLEDMNATVEVVASKKVATFVTTHLSTYAAVDTTVKAATGGDVSDENINAASSTGDIKYFYMNLYDYDDRINVATTKLEMEKAGVSSTYELEMRNGIYFSDGDPVTNSRTIDDLSEVKDGNYYIQNIRANVNGAASWLSVNAQGEIVGVSEDKATIWALTKNSDGTFCLKSGGKYMKIGPEEAGEGLSDTEVAINLSGFVENGTTTGIQLSQKINDTSYYLCQWGGVNVIDYGGYHVNNDGGNGMRLYLVEEGSKKLVNITSKVETEAPFAEWNYWKKDRDADNNNSGQLFYTGLVESRLDANKNIVFTKPEAGIFNDDESIKEVYKNVEIPAFYENGWYTIDTWEQGIYFHENSDQGSSGVAADNTRLYLDRNNPQEHKNMNYADGSIKLWAPFNDGVSFEKSSVNYHFGARSTVPFTMTPNGRVDEANDNSDAVQFKFSGDDDVWVFIDGYLVIDLGGIHNKIDAVIDFAANTVTYSEDNDLELETGSYNDPNFENTQTLFGNLIPQGREVFATKANHELTVFFLERGGGSSNFQIEFNLPLNDSVVVTKDATRSYNSSDKSETPLTDKEQVIADQREFKLKLFRNSFDPNGVESFKPVVGRYNLLNKDGNVIEIKYTDNEGNFTLKNGQSAKFIFNDINVPAIEGQANERDKTVKGSTFYVEEENLLTEAFTEPDYLYEGTSGWGDYEYVNTVDGTANGTYSSANQIPKLELYNKNFTSGRVTIYGKDSTDDTIKFICRNFADATLPNPSALPYEDKYVIDYGLGVELDVLRNDDYRGNDIDIVDVCAEGECEISSDGQSYQIGDRNDKIEEINLTYGTAKIIDNKIVYSPTKQLSGVETLEYVIKVTGTKIDALEQVQTAYKYAKAKVYIMPATTMYYEEDFISYTSGDWQDVGEKETAYQEPGEVGARAESPYGSDIAYLNDSADSNGASKYINTQNGAAEFRYTFTGKATSIFARTSKNSGCIKVSIYEGASAEGTPIYETIRNTIYREDDTLYNIPVFTYEADDYGTYTIVVRVAKQMVAPTSNIVIYGGDFWLDGIRVTEPLDPTDPYASVAQAAYVEDREANMTMATLRYKLLTDVTTDQNGELVWSVEDQTDGNFVLFTDSKNNAMISASDYESKGPKEEVYLNDGQKISFELIDLDPTTNRIYIGMKAPKGTAKAIIGHYDVQLNNSVDCYYDVTDIVKTETRTIGDKTVVVAVVEIKAAEDCLVSLTNVKVTGNTEFSIVQNNQDIEVQ